MSPVAHTAISGVTSLAFGYITRSWLGAGACFLSGIFIDIDHFLDYILHRKKFPFQYNDLFSFCAREKAGKQYLLLHSYEFWILYWIAVFVFQLGLLWIGIGIGITIHLLADQLTNPVRPFVYFITYRIKHGFNKKYIFSAEEYKKLV